MHCSGPTTTAESRGRGGSTKEKVNQVTGTHTEKDPEDQSIPGEGDTLDPAHYLMSDTHEEESVNQITVSDNGSHSRCAKVRVEGVPMYGLLDTGADITIIGGTLFKKVAIVGKLKKRDLRKPDR